MKKELSTKTGLLTATILFAGMFAATACAGPGPQHWTRKSTAAKPGANSHQTMTTTDAKSVAACTGCRTTPVKVYTDRGPAGKSVVVSKVVGEKHECTSCNAVVAHAKAIGTESSLMHASKCAEMRCCVVAAK